MDLSGSWSIKEDFSRGLTSGIVKFIQKGNKLTGTMDVTETIEDEAPIQVKQTIEGHIEENRITFKALDFKIINGPDDAEYCLDNWEGTMNSIGQIIGSSIDEQGLCGVFIMERL